MSKLSDFTTPEQVYVDLAERDKEVSMWKRIAKGWEKSRDAWFLKYKEKMICADCGKTIKNSTAINIAYYCKECEASREKKEVTGKLREMIDRKIAERDRLIKRIRESEKKNIHQGEQLQKLLKAMDEMYWYLMREGKQWACPICGAEDDCKEDCVFDKYSKALSEVKVDRGGEKNLSMPGFMSDLERDARINKLKNEVKKTDCNFMERIKKLLDECLQNLNRDNYWYLLCDIIDEADSRKDILVEYRKRDEIDKLKKEFESELENERSVIFSDRVKKQPKDIDWERLQNFADKGMEYFLHNRKIAIILMWLKKEVDMIKERKNANS